MRLENLIEDHPMTALGNVPCNGCRACCLHDMIPLMPERGDLIWTYKHEVVATAAGPKAVLQCGETGECIYLGRDGCTIHDRGSDEREDTGKYAARFRATPALLGFCTEHGVEPVKVLDHFEFEYDLPKHPVELRARKPEDFFRAGPGNLHRMISGISA
jgi:hypothetical protein